MHSEFSRVMLQCVLLVEAQIMWSPAAKNSCRDIYLRPFSAESSWTAGASKSARQLSATAPCINPRHFELGIPTLHVLVQPFISKQSKIKHATTTSLLRRWRDGSLDGLSSYFQPFLYFGCDFRRRAAVTGPKETSQINLYFQYKTKKEFRVSSAEHAWPARACCL